MGRRIVALTVLAMVVTIVLFGAPLAVGVAHFYGQDEQIELDRLADVAALAVSSDLVRGRSIDSLPQVEAGSQLAVYEPGGTRLLGAGPANSPQVMDAARSAHVALSTDGGATVIAVPVLDNQTVVGVVRAATGQTEVYQRTVGTWALMAALAAVAMFIGWGFARRQVRRLATPMRALAIAAGRLGDGDFSVRADRCGIPEIDSVAASLDITAGRLGELLARERAFSADASHQLRTPLAGLRLSLESVQEGTERDPEAAIATALRAADRLERTVQDLLVLARDVRHHTVRPMDVSALVADVRSDWQRQLVERGRALRLDVDPTLPAVRVSVEAARQVLTVLLDNALVHGTGTVTVRVRDAEQAVAIDVADEGTVLGVEEERLFARRSTPGSGHGIGLALARSLAEAEGGRLVLASREPTTFTLLLPTGPTPS